MFCLNSFAKIGGNKEYYITTVAEYDQRIANNRDIVTRRYIIVPEFDKDYENILQTKDEDALLAKFSFLLKKANIAWMDKYIQYCDSSIDINRLIKGLYFFSKKEYALAINQLEEYKGEKHIFLKFLLLADCNYELSKGKSDKSILFKHYQLAMDTTENFQKKEMVRYRIKYIKYN